MTLKGEEYAGRHQPLIEPDLFDRVQRVLAMRGGGGSCDRRHDHYLKGAVWCARCGRRLIIALGRGNGGTYFYYLCRGRQEKKCSLPYLAVSAVSKAVERHYSTVRLPANFKSRSARN